MKNIDFTKLLALSSICFFIWLGVDELAGRVALALAIVLYHSSGESNLLKSTQIISKIIGDYSEGLKKSQQIDNNQC